MIKVLGGGGEDMDKQAGNWDTNQVLGVDFLQTPSSEEFVSPLFSAPWDPTRPTVLPTPYLLNSHISSDSDTINVKYTKSVVSCPRLCQTTEEGARCKLYWIYIGYQIPLNLMF